MLREFYTRTPPLPPTYASVLTLLQEANKKVHEWGTVADPGGARPSARAAARGPPAGDRGLFSPQLQRRRVLHTGDTVAFFYAPATPALSRSVTRDDTAAAGTQRLRRARPGVPPKGAGGRVLGPATSSCWVTDRHRWPKGCSRMGVLIGPVREQRRPRGGGARAPAPARGRAARTTTSRRSLSGSIPGVPRGHPSIQLRRVGLRPPRHVRRRADDRSAGFVSRLLRPAVVKWPVGLHQRGDDANLVLALAS